MSSHPSAPRAKNWRLVAAVLAVVLALVVAAGLWARWRPLSDDDAARLAARATVESVREQQHAESSAQAGGEETSDDAAPTDGAPLADGALLPDSALLPDAVLDRQLDALGPPATPSQTRRMAERGEDSPAVASLSDAAARLAGSADDVEDGDLAASLAAVATSWWAADASSPTSGAAAPSDSGSATGDSETNGAAAGGASRGGATAGSVADGETGAAAGGTSEGAAAADKATGSGSPSASAIPGGPEGCEPEQLAAVTAVDRARFVAEAAQARISTADSARADVDATITKLHDALEDGRVAGLLGCDPGPVAAWYDLPEGFTTDPAGATGAAEREASEALVRAVATSTAGQRSWWLEVLRDTARDAQRLDPQKPVTALPGRG